MSDVCLICDERVGKGDRGGVQKGEQDVVVVSKKGIEGLVKASVARNDGKSDFFLGKTSGMVHSHCRKTYTRIQSIVSTRRNSGESEPGTSTGCTRRSKVPQFEFKTKCLFCCGTIDEEFWKREQKKPLGKRDGVSFVRTIETKDNISKAASEREDDWGDQVLRRIASASDLVAAEAMYHRSCCAKFFRSPLKAAAKRGRPSDEYVTAAMDDIYSFLNQKNDDCQYSIEEVMSAIKGEKPTIKTVIAKLKEEYGQRLVISSLRGHKTVLCFREVGDKILNASWYDAAMRGKTPQAERIRIVRAAAAIIKQDIESQGYDSSQYPPTDGFFDAVGDETIIPPTLSTFFDTVLTSKNRNPRDSKKKTVAFSHAVISAVRPRSFISPIMHGIAFFIHRKYGAKSLINLLAKLGFSASYNDAQVLELSAVHASQQPIPHGVFTQYVFDNADYNVATLDGHKTFHSMGGINCLTPASKLPPPVKMDKLKKAPPSPAVGKLGVIPLDTYENSGRIGLKAVLVQDLYDSNPVPEIPLPTLSDVLWFAGKWLRINKIPEWKGYMRSLHESAEKSAVVPLPFINATPSDKNTIYTALKYAAKCCHQQGSETCYVTFDLPLYIKAREIVASSQHDPELKSVVVRLGGFHLLMSFLGSIGYIMAGSGLKEALCTVFAANSVDKMLTGHAFSRAVRGHLLVQCVLADIILNSLEFSNEQVDEVKNLLGMFNDDTLSQETMKQSAQLCLLQTQMHTALSSVEARGPTAALWTQYFHMVSLMKQFIEAERSGNWELHLRSVQQMLPFFHSSGHLQYAKCAHLYLQDMLSLPNTHPQNYEEFTKNFAVSRSGLPGSGNWSDMTIELTLMRSMKTHGGLTSGRGITDAVLAKWIGGAPASTLICTALEDFAGLHFSTGEQHVDLRATRQSRDGDDRKKLFDWFSQHPPFPELQELVSLATGIIGTNEINCHEALHQGQTTMRKMTGQNFGELKQARKDKVSTLGNMMCTVKIHNVVEVVDPLLIFQRVAIYKKNDDDLRDLLCYELAPFPLSLFDEKGMRKTKKSALYQIFPHHAITPNFEYHWNVIDGGFLLHRVRWSTGSTFSLILNQYTTYIQKHYGEKCSVVFDGYSNLANSTKHAEQIRRSNITSSVDVQITEDMPVMTQQQQFLSNERNKEQFIKMLTQKLTAQGVEVIQADADADVTIAQCALEKAETGHPTAVTGEDVDLLVLLIALTPKEQEIKFFKPGKGNEESRTYTTTELEDLPFAEHILFIHAFGGCDTTSAIFRKGKVTIAKLVMKDPSLQQASKVFYSSTSTHDEVANAGETMFLALYKAAVGNVDKHRYLAFVRSTTRVKPELSSLPPTRGSSRQHSYRVYHQVQEWRGNKLVATDWGWSRGDNGFLVPIPTLDPPAPAEVLQNIFCHCTKSCGSGRCGCRRAGIHCSTLCSNCSGSCTNSPQLADDGSSTEDEEEIETEP